jgi:hypothetical protein
MVKLWNKMEGLVIDVSFKIGEDGLVTFSEETVVGKAKVEIPLTESDIESILVTALEGGIGYWACLVNDGADWVDEPNNVPTSQWATKLLLEGKEILFTDEESDKKYTLTLDKVIKGFELNYLKRPWDNDIEEGDATTADCIIQFAIFGEVIYG